MNFTLQRPLIILDTETTGTNVQTDRIVEIGFRVLYPDGTSKTWCRYINPGCPIPAEVTEVHHITDEMVAGEPSFGQLARNLAIGFNNCDYCGYNIKFDLSIIGAEMQRAGVEWSVGDARLLDPHALWRVLMPRTLSDAVRQFLHREPTEAHRALGDAEDAFEVLLAMLEAFKLPPDMDKIHALAFPVIGADGAGKIIWRGKEAAIGFGKHNGTLLRDMPAGYLKWMLNGDFTPRTKELVRDALQGKYPQKGE